MTSEIKIYQVLSFLSKRRILNKFKSVLGETTKIKGLVISVCFNLDGDHEICVKEFNDAENIHKLSEIDSLNVAQIDPHAFFENIKLGYIEIEL